MTHLRAIGFFFLVAGLVSSRVEAATVGLEAFASFSTHSMLAWNDDLELANANGGRFEPLDHSFGYGVGGRFWFSHQWMMRVIWEPLFLESSDPPTGRKLVFDAGTIQLDLAGFLPGRDRGRYGLGMGIGHYSLHGRREYAGVQNAELSGDTFGVQVQGLGEWALNPTLSVTAAAGFRVATISDTQVNGVSPSSKLETDYSGFIARLGLLFAR